MQKQSILSLLNSYVTGSENVRKVINSPCLDFSSGKMLSYDGQKVYNSNSRFGRGKRRGLFNNKRDQSQGKPNNSGNSKNPQGGKSKKKKSDQVTLCFKL